RSVLLLLDEVSSERLRERVTLSGRELRRVLLAFPQIDKHRVAADVEGAALSDDLLLDVCEAVHQKSMPVVHGLEDGCPYVERAVPDTVLLCISETGFLPVRRIEGIGNDRAVVERPCHEGVCRGNAESAFGRDGYARVLRAFRKIVVESL